MICDIRVSDILVVRLDHLRVGGFLKYHSESNVDTSLWNCHVKERY